MVGSSERQTTHSSSGTLQPLGSSPRVTITGARCCRGAVEMKMKWVFSSAVTFCYQNADYLSNANVGSFVPNPLRNTKQIQQTKKEKQRERERENDEPRALAFTLSRVIFCVRCCRKRQKASMKQTPARNVSLGTDRTDCNEAPRAPVRPRQKDPSGVLHTHGGRGVPISLSSPLWVWYSEWLCSTLSYWSIRPVLLFSSQLVTEPAGKCEEMAALHKINSPLPPPFSCQTLLPILPTRTGGPRNQRGRNRKRLMEVPASKSFFMKLQLHLVLACIT